MNPGNVTIFLLGAMFGAAFAVVSAVAVIMYYDWRASREYGEYFRDDEEDSDED